MVRFLSILIVTLLASAPCLSGYKEGHEKAIRDGVPLVVFVGYDWSVSVPGAWSTCVGALEGFDKHSVVVAVPDNGKLYHWRTFRGNEPIIIPAKYNADDALDEVNAKRAARGLRPFIHDAGLTVAAKSAANERAASLNVGHCANDFVHVPSGSSATSAGCAAWEPGFGWGSCCWEEDWTYAGAAWTMGRDGKRYMHIFVR